MPRPVAIDAHLDGALDDLTGLGEGMDLILAGLHQIATAPHSLDQTQTLIAALAGSAGADLVSAIGYLVQHLTNPGTSPALAGLTEQQQKTTQRYGEQAAYHLDDPDLHQSASEASAAITGT